MMHGGKSRSGSGFLRYVLYRTNGFPYGILCNVLLSPLQVRISELCSAAVATEDPEELERIVPQLKAALQEQTALLRAMVEDAKQVIAQLPSDSLVDRRKTRRKTTAPAEPQVSGDPA